MNPNQLTSEILTPTSYVILSLGEVSQFIERKYGCYLKPPPAGIYKVGDQLPSILSGEIYFVKKLNNKTYFEQLKNINDLVSGDYVVDKNGNIVLDHFMINSKETSLSNIPTVPTTGFNICKGVVQHYVSSKNRYTNESTNYISSIGKNFKDKNNFGSDITQLDIIHKIIEENAFLGFYQQLDSFIFKDVCHVYFYKTIGICDLIVEKTIDWRAYQWHLTQTENLNECDNF